MTAFKSPHDRRRTPYIAAAIGLAGLLAPVFAGCGSPPIITPEGAWSVSFIDSGIDCTIAGHNTLVGEVTGDTRTDLIADAEDNTDVYCTVADNGGSFLVDAGASKDESVLAILINELKPNATKDNPSVGTVQYKSHNTADFFNAADCNFYFQADTGQGVKEGEVWLTFDCPDIAGEAGTCQITPGYAAFEKCKTTDE